MNPNITKKRNSIALKKNMHVTELLELAGAAQISPIVKLQVSAIRANNANKMANVVQAACKEAVLGQGKAIGAAGGSVGPGKFSAAVAKAVQGQAQSTVKEEKLLFESGSDPGPYRQVPEFPPAPQLYLAMHVCGSHLRICSSCLPLPPG